MVFAVNDIVTVMHWGSAVYGGNVEAGETHTITMVRVRYQGTANEYSQYKLGYSGQDLDNLFEETDLKLVKKC